MADDGRREGNNSRKNYYWGEGAPTQGEQSGDFPDEQDQPQRPDIAAHHRNTQMESSPAPGSSGSDSSLRDSNPPFSFKHFLSRSSSGSVGAARGGARPKVYPPPSTPPPSPQPMHSRLIPNEVTGLPDFVQDHLVIEQCYLNSPSLPHLAVDLDNIPPPGSPDNEFGPCGLGRADIPFDLTRRERFNVGEVPLDLPPSLALMQLDIAATEQQVINSPSSSHHHHLQGEQHVSPPPVQQQQQHSSEVVGSSKSLPDFLSDGPMIRSERRGPEGGIPSDPGSPTSSHPDSRHSPNNRLNIENDRLRREVDSLRRMLSDQVARTESLESELCILRNQDQSNSAALEKVFEQVEDNLKRTTKRAITAESQVSKLKEDVRTLTNQLNTLTRTREGAAASSSVQQTDNERLASQLRNAANTAELSLRHLLLGVDNLRQLAVSLEPQASSVSSTAGRIRLSSSSDDSQDDNQTGPAL